MQLVQFLCAHQLAHPLLQQLCHLEEQKLVGLLHLKKKKKKHIHQYFNYVMYLTTF